MPLGFGQRSADRLTDVVRRVEQMPREDAQGPLVLPNTVELHWLRITSTTKTDDRYPAERYDRNAEAKSFTRRESCWLDTPNNDALLVDTYYPAKLSGTRLADKREIYDLITPTTSVSFLALLTDKDYSASATFPAYSWTKVVDSGSLTYAETSPAQTGGPGNKPAYHEQQNDLPVSRTGARVDIATTQQGGGTLNEIQSVAIVGATGGTFTLTFDGQITAAIAYNVTAVQLEAALEALSNITNVTVTGTGTSADPFLVTFMDSFANVPQMTSNTPLLLPRPSMLPHSVVRLRKGAGDYYLVEQLPFEDLFERTASSDADGTIGYQRIFRQATQTWVRGIEVRIVAAN